jgi:hypothetical protein
MELDLKVLQDASATLERKRKAVETAKTKLAEAEADYETTLQTVRATKQAALDEIAAMFNESPGPGGRVRVSQG